MHTVLNECIDKVISVNTVKCLREINKKTIESAFLRVRNLSTNVLRINIRSTVDLPFLKSA